jgi:cobalamin synthase
MLPSLDLPDPPSAGKARRLGTAGLATLVISPLIVLSAFSITRELSTILVTFICMVCAAFILGVLSLVFAFKASREVRRNVEGTLKPSRMGLVLGLLSTAISGLILLVIGLSIALAAYEVHHRAHPASSAACQKNLEAQLDDLVRTHEAFAKTRPRPQDVIACLEESAVP